MATVAHTLESEERESLPLRDFGLVEIPPEAHTYSGFIEWVLSGKCPEKLRVTYNSGVVSLDMTEENIDTHTEVKAAVYRTLFPLVAEQDFGKLYADGVLIGNPDAEVSNNPDAVAFRWSSVESGRVRFLERKGQRRAVEGSPDWVLEIVSDSSVGKDTKRLRKAYHRAGVEEYWLIDARGEQIEFHILFWRQSGYVPASGEGGWLTSRVFDREFRLTRTQDRLGMWTYKLEVRPKGTKTKTRKQS